MQWVYALIQDIGKINEMSWRKMWISADAHSVGPGTSKMAPGFYFYFKIPVIIMHTCKAIN